MSSVSEHEEWAYHCAFYEVNSSEPSDSSELQQPECHRVREHMLLISNRYSVNVPYLLLQC